jgi:hypothetical protein
VSGSFAGCIGCDGPATLFGSPLVRFSRLDRRKIAFGSGSFRVLFLSPGITAGLLGDVTLDAILTDLGFPFPLSEGGTGVGVP